MAYALPALLVGLTALVTSALVHAGYAIWWLSQVVSRGHAAYDWTGALAVSGTATTIVLIAALIVRRLAAANAPPAETLPAPEAVPVRCDR